MKNITLTLLACIVMLADNVRGNWLEHDVDEFDKELQGETIGFTTDFPDIFNDAAKKPVYSAPYAGSNAYKGPLPTLIWPDCTSFYYPQPFDFSLRKPIIPSTEETEHNSKDLQVEIEKSMLKTPNQPTQQLEALHQPTGKSQALPQPTVQPMQPKRSTRVTRKPVRYRS